MAVSGTYTFDPTLADIVLDAFDRIQIRPAALTVDHMLSARRSLNFALVRFANRGINLWSVDEQTVLLNEGQIEYSVPSNTVMMLDTWVRQYQFVGPEDVVPAITTTNLSASVLVEAGFTHNLSVGDYVLIPIYVALGGVVLQGTYQVVTVPSSTSFTVTAAVAASGNAGPGGLVPSYATTSGSQIVTVTLAAHGKVSGDVFTVHVPETVGGVTLAGDYTITVLTANTFTLDSGQTAANTTSSYENDGDMQISVQAANVSPQDRMMFPISRTTWANQPNKFQTGPTPTIYWFDRTDPPTVNIWQPSDGSIVQELHYFRMRQLMDANPQGTETPDIPYRFEEALCSTLAYMLAIKWLPASAGALKDYAEDAWTEAAHEDRERVTLDLTPQTDAYWR